MNPCGLSAARTFRSVEILRARLPSSTTTSSHTLARSSSLVRAWPADSTRASRVSNTLGSSATTSLPLNKSRCRGSSVKLPKVNKPSSRKGLGAIRIPSEILPRVRRTRGRATPIVADMKPTTPAAAMLFAIGLLFASPAHAASISLDYHLSASGFGPFAPVDPVTFTFHLAVDDAVAVTDQTYGLTVTDSNLALPSTMAFRYSPAGAGGFAIYGLQAGANLSQETDDFLAKFFFDTDFSIWRLHEFLYVTAD